MNPHTHEDDSLYGLLSAYKAYNTYIRVLHNGDEEMLSLQIADNPKRWYNIPGEKYESYELLRRLDLDVDKLSVKYLLPEHIVKVRGPMLGIKIPQKNVEIYNRLEKEGYLIIDVPERYLPAIKQGVGRLVRMKPHRKYEILEKSFIEED